VFIKKKEDKGNKHQHYNSSGKNETTNSLVQFKDERASTKRITQLQSLAKVSASRQQVPIQKKEEPVADNRENNTGLPDQLKAGIENLSGISMDDVKVYRNSDKPAQLQAHAYAQGTDIHLGPGQEKHLPHEAWHVVQQKQGRVQPTVQLNSGANVNDNIDLENEADAMGKKALQMKSFVKSPSEPPLHFPLIQKRAFSSVIQRVTSITHTYSYVTPDIGDKKTNYKVGRKVVALLDPKDPIKGSATGAHWDWMRPMREKYGNIVKGHLLNHDLGGFAKEENLYPITSKANHEHSSQVEQKVKKELFERKNNDKRRLRYEVTVKEAKAHDPKKAQFHCWWGWEAEYLESDEELGKAIIDSNMKPGINYGGFQGTLANKYDMNSDNKVAANWYHGSRAEEQYQVNADWEKHQKNWPYSHKISVWGAADTYGIPKIRQTPKINDAEKLAYNNTSQVVKNNREAIEPYNFTLDFKKRLEKDGYEETLINQFMPTIDSAFDFNLHVGEGKAQKIKKLLAQNPDGLENKLKKMVEGITDELLSITNNARNKLQTSWDQKPSNKPKSAFIKKYWDEEIIDEAKTKISGVVEIAVDQEKWEGI
tara:strand:+ start:516 stop:2303 length:1788 start_codon:yes stop_codon:yes gene_type:complete